MSRETCATPHTLVLPRAVLDAAVARAWPAGAGAAPFLAHGPLVLHSAWGNTLGLVGPLRSGGFRRDGAGARAVDGVALLACMDATAQPPASPAQWEAWLGQHAAGFRLAAQSANPVLAVLWLRPDGTATAACRVPPGSGPGHSAAGAQWHPVAALRLPGAGMQTLALPSSWGGDSSAATAALSPALLQAGDESHSVDIDPISHGRYSRQAAALGADVLARLQSSRIAVVGTGRIGSAVAHSLARMGANLLLLEPDLMEEHNLDGDLPPLHEGRPKVQAMARYLRGLMRPGAVADARMLPIASPAAGALLADADVVLCCVDNDGARFWANAWALALLKPFADVATGVHAHGAEADIRCLPPGTGCLACVGGFAQRGQLLQQLSQPQPQGTPADFRLQRRGSLRSWGQFSAHLGLRLLEQLYTGQLDRALHRRLSETAEGGLQVRDHSPGAPRLEPPGAGNCPLCGNLLGAGLAAVQPAAVQALAQAVLAMPAAA